MLGRFHPPPGSSEHVTGAMAIALEPLASFGRDLGGISGTLAPLQTSLGGFDALQVVLVAMAAASTVLGLYVGYQGYRGFRRNDSVPMKFLSLGLILLTAVTYALSFGGSLAFQYELAPAVLRPIWQLSVRGSQLAGLACIVYSLYRRP